MKRSTPIFLILMYEVVGTVYFMEWSHGLETWIGAMEWSIGVEPWSEILERKRFTFILVVNFVSSERKP